MSTSTDDLRLTIAWFESAESKGGIALGDPEVTTWGNFVSIFEWRREGHKDGCCFTPAQFQIEPDGRHVHRKGTKVTARTAVTLDIETSKKIGQVPPSLPEAMDRAQQHGWAALGYSSHNNRPNDIRYRLTLPLSEQIAPELPAPEVVAEHLGILDVTDLSKINPASVFFLPSCPYGSLDLHQTMVIPGEPIAADWMVKHAGALLAARQAEADRVAALGQAEAAARREEKMAAGFTDDDSLIDRIRAHLDLDQILQSHGYDKSGSRYRHPNSDSGSFGADIKTFGGIQRVFSHNGSDPLHADNLPGWCNKVTAVDGFDAMAILDFAGDRTAALRELAQRFNLTKTAEKKAMAGLLFRLIRRQASQMEIEALAFAEGARLGLTRDDVIRTAIWVSDQAVRRAA